MAIDFAHQHANGFTSEGSVTPDKLYDRFDVRRKGVVASGQGVLARGTALGKITATNKWVKSLAASSDGSQVIRAFLLHDIDATSADVEAVMGRRGRCVQQGIILGAGHTFASIDDACIDRGLIIETAIG